MVETTSNEMTLFELEKHVAQLPPEQLAEFIDSIKELDSDLWDQQIEKRYCCWTP